MVIKNLARKLALVLVYVLLLTSPISVNAEYLPIDITAIGRQQRPPSLVTDRLGANLFTDDAQVINDILVQQVQDRQAVALYLFAAAATTYEIDSHTKLMANANALFSQPSHHGSFNIPVEDEFWSWWLIAFVVIIAAIVGLIWAVISNAKKKENTTSVY